MLKKIIVEIKSIPAIKKTYLKYLRPVQAKKYKGNDVECAICGAKYRVFKNWTTDDINAVCFNCNSHRRHRLLWKYFHEKTDLLSGNKPKTILHFAPEKYFFDLFSNIKNAKYIPCDLFPIKYNKECETNIIGKIDITNIPLEDESVDFILCSHVLEHIPDDNLAMSELCRVMKKGGWGIFQVPIKYDLEETYEDFTITSLEGREKAFGQHDHVRLYGKDYIKKLKKFDWEVIEDDYIKQFSNEEVFHFGFDETELIYICRK